jgi:hypothetical protein
MTNKWITDNKRDKLQTLINMDYYRKLKSVISNSDIQVVCLSRPIF